MKTASIERYQMWGTPRHHARAMYRGKTIRYVSSEGGRPVFVILDAPHWFGLDHDALMAEWRTRLHALGFTHIRFVGDWGNTAPKGGKL